VHLDIRLKKIAAILMGLLLTGCAEEFVDANYWEMHTIEDELHGADGVDLFDIDGDGDLDALSSWEESAAVLLHENPGGTRVTEPWQRTPVSGGLDMRKVEDARYADLNFDGRINAVVTATENHSEKIGLHWLTNPEAPYQATSWSGEWVEPRVNHLFIKIAVGQIDGQGAADFAVGSKSDTKPARLLWYQAPPDPTINNVADWQAHEIAEIEWTDSLEIVDLNGDGANDLLLGYWNHLAWYENPGKPGSGAAEWRRHMISDTTHSYFSRCDETGPAAMRWVVGADISGAVAGDTVAWLISKELDENAQWHGRWLQQRITSPDAIPRDPEHREYWVKSIACGNIDEDPRPDIVMSISGMGHGVFALLNLADGPGDQSLRLQTIASALPNSRKGIKYDDLRLADVDLDGDLDVVTTEENGSMVSWWLTRGLGLIWYENPGPFSD
jgi:hypothetical protein